MATIDTTVNIRGNASQLESELRNISTLNDRFTQQRTQTVNDHAAETRPLDRGNDQRTDNSQLPNPTPNTPQQPNPQPPPNQPPPNQQNNGIIDNIRREVMLNGAILTGGSANYRQLIQQSATIEKQRQLDAINTRTETERTRLRTGQDLTVLDEADRRTEEYRQRRLSSAVNPDDPTLRATVDYESRAVYNREVRNITNEREQQLDTEAEADRVAVEEELARAIRDLTEEFDRQNDGTDSDRLEESFLGGLRRQRNQLIQERDAATTEEEAQEKQDEINRLNNRMSLNRGANDQNAGLGGLQFAGGVLQATNALEEGDLIGTGLGLAIASKNPYAIAGMAALNAAQSIVLGGSKLYDSTQQIAGMRPFGAKYAGEASQYGVFDTLFDDRYRDRNYAHIGLSTEEFVGEITRRAKQRRSTQDFSRVAFEQIGVERAGGLETGTLGEAGKFDRYGTESTRAFTQMISILNSINSHFGVNTGVSIDDFSKNQEKFAIQQGIMQGYLGRMENPDAFMANSLLARFSSMGTVQDERVGQDIQAWQNMIQKPKNERMDLMVMSVIQDLLPETTGRTDLIDRVRKNPEKYLEGGEQTLMEAMAKRIQAQYGNRDTETGYWAWQTALSELGTNPERIDKMVQDMTSGQGKQVQRFVEGNKQNFEKYANQDVKRLTDNTIEYQTYMMSKMKSISQYWDEVKTWRLFRNAKSNKTYVPIE
jgi:hypothetical protein